MSGPGAAMLPGYVDVAWLPCFRPLRCSEHCSTQTTIVRCIMACTLIWLALPEVVHRICFWYSFSQEYKCRNPILNKYAIYVFLIDCARALLVVDNAASDESGISELGDTLPSTGLQRNVA